MRCICPGINHLPQNRHCRSASVRFRRASASLRAMVADRGSGTWTTDRRTQCGSAGPSQLTSSHPTNAPNSPTTMPTSWGSSTRRPCRSSRRPSPASASTESLSSSCTHGIMAPTQIDSKLHELERRAGQCVATTPAAVGPRLPDVGTEQMQPDGAHPKMKRTAESVAVDLRKRLGRENRAVTTIFDHRAQRRRTTALAAVRDQGSVLRRCT